MSESVDYRQHKERSDTGNSGQCEFGLLLLLAVTWLAFFLSHPQCISLISRHCDLIGQTFCSKARLLYTDNGGEWNKHSSSTRVNLLGAWETDSSSYMAMGHWKWFRCGLISLNVSSFVYFWQNVPYANVRLTDAQNNHDVCIFMLQLYLTPFHAHYDVIIHVLMWYIVVHLNIGTKSGKSCQQVVNLILRFLIRMVCKIIIFH